MTTASFRDQGFFARVVAFFTAVVEVIRETREMRATFGNKYDE